MKSGYTLIATLGLIILLSSMVVGLNALTSSTLRKSSSSKELLEAEIAADSTLEISKAIILGNITLPIDDNARIKFDGTRISCGMQLGYKSGLRVQDIAGLLDLRLASDELLATVISEFSSVSATRNLLAEIRKNAQSGNYLRAYDVLLASQFPIIEAETLAPFVTIHGRRSRLAREVAPPQLLSLASRAGIDNARVFGASPTNSVFRVEVAAVGKGRRGVFSEALLQLDYSNGGRFKEVYEIRSKKRISAEEIARHKFANNNLQGVICELD